MSTPPGGVSDPLDIRLFGPLEIRRQGVLLPPMRSRKARALCHDLCSRKWIHSTEPGACASYSRQQYRRDRDGRVLR